MLGYGDGSNRHFVNSKNLLLAEGECSTNHFLPASLSFAGTKKRIQTAARRTPCRQKGADNKCAERAFRLFEKLERTRRSKTHAEAKTDRPFPLGWRNNWKRICRCVRAHARPYASNNSWAEFCNPVISRSIYDRSKTQVTLPRRLSATLSIP